MFVIETAIYMIPVYEERQKIQYMYIVERYIQDRTIKVEKNYTHADLLRIPD